MRGPGGGGKFWLVAEESTPFEASFQILSVGVVVVLRVKTYSRQREDITSDCVMKFTFAFKWEP